MDTSSLPQGQARLIIVTGPESSGKTTLSKALAQELSGVWLPEYPRAYLEAVGRKAVVEDFHHFVAANDNLVRAAAEKLRREGKPDGFIIQDTGAEVLHVWQQDKFGLTSEPVAEGLHRQCPGLYLLSRPDLAWEYDPLREDPHRRDELFGVLRSLVSKRDCLVREVSGFGESRLKTALQTIHKVLGS